MPLKAKDKKVVDAFYARRSMDGTVVSTDGKRLIYNHGSETMATWEGGKVVVAPKMPYVKSQEAVLRYMRKSFPKNVLKEGLSTTEIKLHRLLGELRREDEGEPLEERAPLPKAGGKLEVDGQQFKVVKVYAGKADTVGPLPRELVRLVPRGGGAAVLELVKGSMDKGHYVVYFNQHGDLDGHPVWMKPMQVKRAMQYEGTEAEGETLDEVQKYPTMKAEELLDKMQRSVIPMVNRALGAAAYALPTIEGQKGKEMLAKAHQAATLITQANTKLYEAHGLLSEVKRSGK